LPLYEYRCTKCGYTFDKIQSFSAKPDSECPRCKGELERPLFAPAFHFVGGGWYVNDYGGKSSSSPATNANAPVVDSKPAAADSTGATPAAAAAAPANPSTPSAS